MNRELYYINVTQSKRNTAGMKAPMDISEISRRLGMESLSMPRFPSERREIYKKLWLVFVGSSRWRKLSRALSEGGVVLFQHPMYGNRLSAHFIPRIKERKHCKFIAVIHDLESLRKGIEGVFAQSEKTGMIADNLLLRQFDVIICHNEHMKQYLITQGFSEERLVSLGIFDYLCKDGGQRPVRDGMPSIAIAGNLAIGKCAYIYGLFGHDGKENQNLTVHLFGNNYDESHANDHMIYHGSFAPEELPAHLEGDFGLVWDGTSAETCAGNTGEYLKYNNPHKTSLYLASGMPVIVWSQSAMADFVQKNGVGVVVDSLYGLDEMLTGISAEDYRIMCKNVSEIGKKIRSGYYFTTALQRGIDILEKEMESPASGV